MCFIFLISNDRATFTLDLLLPVHILKLDRSRVCGFDRQVALERLDVMSRLNFHASVVCFTCVNYLGAWRDLVSLDVRLSVLALSSRRFV